MAKPYKNYEEEPVVEEKQMPKQEAEIEQPQQPAEVEKEQKPVQKKPRYKKDDFWDPFWSINDPWG